MTHDPLCDWRECTCPRDYDVPQRGHRISCPEYDCECDLIAKVRADEAPKAVGRYLEERRRVVLAEIMSR